MASFADILLILAFCLVTVFVFFICAVLFWALNSWVNSDTERARRSNSRARFEEERKAVMERKPRKDDGDDGGYIDDDIDYCPNEFGIYGPAIREMRE